MCIITNSDQNIDRVQNRNVKQLVSKIDTVTLISNRTFNSKPKLKQSKPYYDSIESKSNPIKAKNGKTTFNLIQTKLCTITHVYVTKPKSCCKQSYSKQI